MRRILLLALVLAACSPAEAGDRPRLHRSAHTAATTAPSGGPPAYVNVRKFTPDGTNEYFTAGDMPFGGASRVVFSARIKQANCVATEVVLGKWGTSPNFEVRSELFASTSLCGVITYLSPDGTTNTRWSSGADAFPENAWGHVCWSYDGSQTGNANRLKHEINGVDVTAAGGFVGTIPASIANTAEIAYFGTLNTGSGFFIGDIDEVIVWIGGNPPSCSAIHNGGTLLDPANSWAPYDQPTACWRFNTADITTIPDGCGSWPGTPSAGVDADDFGTTDLP